MNEEDKRDQSIVKRYDPSTDRNNIANVSFSATDVSNHLLAKLERGEFESLKKERKEPKIKYEKALLPYKDLIEKLKENGFSNEAISEIFKTKITSSDSKIIPIFCPPHQLGLFINKHLPRFAGAKKKQKK
ncbi:TPA: hypothetical protein ACX6Q1_003805 [Photobacterium damselae]